MDSGKRRRVMIGCVTFETVKVCDPVKYYDTEIVHLIHFVKNPDSQEGLIYSSFYEESKHTLEEDGKTVIEHNNDVSSFPEMMKILSDILDNEYSLHPNTDVFINISAGSSEYVAAATLTSMMYEKAICFSVKTKEYTTKPEKIKELYFENNRPIGLTKTVHTPTVVPKIDIPLPERRLILGLRIYTKSDGKASTVIKRLKDSGLWIRQNSEEMSDRYDSVYYHRDFVSKWIKNGWVEKDTYCNKYNITDTGRRVLSIFYVNSGTEYI